MAATVIITRPTNGEEIVLPYIVEGQATGATAPPTNIISIIRQIDDGPPVDVSAGCNPPLPTHDTAFSFELTSVDCPQVGRFYLLSVIAWDDQGDGSEASVVFKVVDFSDVGKEGV